MNLKMKPLASINLPVLWFILSICYVVTVFTLNDRRDLMLTLTEKNALEKVWDQLPEQFMKSDLYLIRWVRKAHLDIQQAKQLLLNMIKWREKNNITNIVLEDWSDLEEDYKMSFDAVDKEGRPVLFVDYGDWDIRAAVLQGKGPRLSRYLMLSSEMLMQNITKLQNEGKQVTRCVTVTDAEGTSLRTHGCVLCTSILTNWVRDSETYYPGNVDETIIINAPGFATVVFNLLRGVMTEELSSQAKVFNGNKKAWMDYLDQRIDKQCRTVRYGGTKI